MATFFGRAGCNRVYIQRFGFCGRLCGGGKQFRAGMSKERQSPHPSLREGWGTRRRCEWMSNLFRSQTGLNVSAANELDVTFLS
jgi:hypothetical protein